MKTAVLSTDGVYRYRLGRSWGDGPCLGWIMLNPSTADAEVDDPTIRRCIGFAKTFGFDGIDVVNLYAYRATNPRDLVDAAGAGVSPTGAENAETIEQVIGECPKVVAAWGSTFADSRGTFLLPRLNVEGVAGRCGRSPLWCLGLTKNGHPRHPLYVRRDAELQVWR